jgi:hypothetical protein
MYAIIKQAAAFAPPESENKSIVNPNKNAKTRNKLLFALKGNKKIK